MDDLDVEALRLLCEREGGFRPVAAMAKVNDQTLYQILKRVPLKSGKPRGVGRDVRNKLDAAFPGWRSAPHQLMGNQIGGHKTAEPIDLHLSSVSANNDPITIEWEKIVLVELPEEFWLVIPDDSLAPAFSQGTSGCFNRSAAPAAGKPVLLRDGAGNAFLRYYQPKRPGRWMAITLTNAYAPMDSVDDGLEIMAAMIGHRWA